MLAIPKWVLPLENTVLKRNVATFFQRRFPFTKGRATNVRILFPKQGALTLEVFIFVSAQINSSTLIINSG